MALLALLALRYKEEPGKESKYLALQIGQIESAADSVHIFKATGRPFGSWSFVHVPRQRRQRSV
jgi:hypothetical protein